jgi:hypothetical protein
MQTCRNCYYIMISQNLFVGDLHTCRKLDKIIIHDEIDIENQCNSYFNRDEKLKLIEELKQTPF